MKRITLKVLMPIIGLSMMLLLTGCPKDDGKSGDFSLDTLLVSTPDNISPVAIAGFDQIILKGGTVTLDGIESYDEDGQIVSYQWLYIDGTPIGNNMILNLPTSELPAGTYEIALLVTDDDGATDVDTLIVTIKNPPLPPVSEAVNEAPIADAGVDQSITVFGLNSTATIAAPIITVDLDGSGSSDDGLIQPLAYAWAKTNHATINLVLSDSTSATPSFGVSCSDDWVGNCTSGVDSSTCRYEFTLTVNDGELTATDTVDINVDYFPCKFGEELPQ